MAPTSHILLRLDDGSLIGDAAKLGSAGSSGVIRISMEQAFAMGRVGEAEIRRLERVLFSLQGATGTSHPHQNGGYSQQQPPPRSLQPAAAAHAAATPQYEQYSNKRPRAAPPPPPPVAEPDFYPKCHQILQKSCSHMGPLVKRWFWLPVNRAAVADYYKIVKSPISLSEIDRKLTTRAYASPHDFHADMSRLWSNCRLYNKATSDVGKAGLNEEAFYEQLWAASGWAQDARGRRATAGIAAAKFDPEVYVPPSKTKSGARGGESQGGSARSGGGKRAQPSTAHSGGGREGHSGQQTAGTRAMSTDYGNAPLSGERIIEIGAQLNAMAESEHPLLQDMLDLIPPGCMPAGEDGEMELDFEHLDQATMAKLDQFLRKMGDDPTAAAALHANRAPASPTAMSLNPSVRLEAASSDEDDDGGQGSDSD